MTTIPTAPSLVGGRIRLVALTPDDYGFLYSLAVDSKHPYRWRFRAFVPRIEQFVEGLWTDVLAQFVVTTHDGERLGHVVAYGGDLRNGNTGMAVIVREDFVGSGVGPEAAFVMARYLFASWNLQKIYMDVPEFNLELFGSGQDRYFKSEGVQAKHIYHQGAHHDLHHLAIFREDFDRFSSRVNSLLEGLEQRMNGAGAGGRLDA